MTFHAFFIFTCILFSMNSFLTAMDTPTTISGKKSVFCGKLFIDQDEYLQKYPHHTNKHGHAIAYIVQKHRQRYPYTETFKKAPLRSPFVHIKIILNTDPHKKILTIIPAQKLINCTDESGIDLLSGDFLFHLICTKNEKFVIDQEYFPTDILKSRNEKIKNSFETQFLSCMNQFYKSPAYCPFQSSIQELLSQKVLIFTPSSEIFETQDRYFVVEYGFYTHGLKGCSSEKHLIDLATNIKTKHDNYSPFNYLTRREYANKPQPKYHQSIDFDFILTTCLREMEYEDKACEKILNECIDELIARNLLTKICINQFMMRTFIQFIINQQLHKK